MRSLVVGLAVLCVGLAGCKKSMDNLEKQGYGSGESSNQSGPYSGGGNPTVGGAAQAVRGAATKAEVRNAISQIHLFIENASVGGTMPSVESTYAALQKEAPKYAKMVDDKVIYLNPVTTREEVWAYSASQFGGVYIFCSGSGVEELNEQAFRQRLGR